MPTIIIKSGTPPTADPDQLEVSPDEEFDFSGDDPFKVVFTDESPDKNNPDKKRKSSDGKIKMKAKNKKGTYPYTILIGDQAVDPAIIIK